MTLADASSRKVDIIGPQGLTHFIATMRKYAMRYVFHSAPRSHLISFTGIFSLSTLPKCL